MLEFEIEGEIMMLLKPNPKPKLGERPGTG